MAKTYPISVVLTDKAVLVVGGGEVATRKVKGLLECRALVTVISPEVTSELCILIREGLCNWVKRNYDSFDLSGRDGVAVPLTGGDGLTVSLTGGDGVAVPLTGGDEVPPSDPLLVFVCTDDEEVNARVSRDATKRGLLVNVADRPELSSFYLPSVLRRGMLSLAVSTEGSSPLTARHIREDLEEQFDETMGIYLELLQSWRQKIITTLPADKRLLFWQQVGEGQVYELVRQGHLNQAEELLDNLYQASASKLSR